MIRRSQGIQTTKTVGLECLHPELESGRNGHRGDVASRFRRSHKLRFLTHGVQLDGDRPITKEPRHFADHGDAL